MLTLAASHSEQAFCRFTRFLGVLSVLLYISPGPGVTGRRAVPDYVATKPPTPEAQANRRTSTIQILNLKPFHFQAASAVPPGHMRIPSRLPDKHISSPLNTLSTAIPLSRQLRPIIQSAKTRSMPPKATILGFQSVDAAIQISEKKKKNR